MNTALRSLLTARLAAVEERLQRACQRGGRLRSEVTLVAVTKTVGVDVAELLPELGVFDLGENRPQELWRKAAALPKSVRWHLIGHLQRNKIERTVPLVHCLHAVDSLRLLAALEETGRPVDVLLEVNASREASKQGFAPEEVPGLADAVCGLRHVRVRGLMTMAALEEDAERCRPTFVLLRSLRDQLQAALGKGSPSPPSLGERGWGEGVVLAGSAPSPPTPLPRSGGEGRHTLDQLSMGMSNDFEVAVEEGATLVRLGTVLLGDLPEGQSR